MSQEKQIQNIILKRRASNVLYKIEGNIAYIVYNRPKRANALTSDMYLQVAEFIRTANTDNTIKFIVIRGEGNSFCTGNDLSNFIDPELAEFSIEAKVRTSAYFVLQNFGKAFIQSNKPIFAIVQGQVTGVAFTQLALMDGVFATEDAVFRAPLVKLAQGPEMCSAYTFPKFFGDRIAKDLIIKAEEVNSKFLEKYQFLISCKDIKDAESKLKSQLDILNELQWVSYLECRKLMRLNLIPTLLQINRLECDNLVARWSNPELPAHLLKYLKQQKQRANLKKKSKL